MSPTVDMDNSLKSGDALQDSEAVETGVSPPLPEHVTLLDSLDRMLTVGSYYPAGHEKYVEVSVAAREALRVALGPARLLSLTIKENGLELNGSFVPAQQREAKRLHELLDPLNIAVLEIDADTSVEELHVALTTLKQHHASLAGARSYQEITIEGLPETVRTTGRSFYVKTKGRGTGPGGTKIHTEYFDPHAIPDAALVPTPEGQHMEREFLAVVQGIMKNSDPSLLNQLQNSSDELTSQVLESWVPDAAIKTIKGVIDALNETNQDPMVLQRLIGDAQAALSLTGDPELVELVFEKLRKEDDKKKKKVGSLLKNRPKPRDPRKNPVTFTMTRAEMHTLIGEVNAAVRPVEDLMAGTGADCLGICFQVLVTGPSDVLSEGVSELLRQLITAEDFSGRDTGVIVQALRSAILDSKPDITDEVVAALCTPLRQARPKLLGWVWLAVWERLIEDEHKVAAWPYLVNDLMMGLEWTDSSDQLSLYKELTDYDPGEQIGVMVKLESLQAMREKTLGEDLFLAPVPLLYPIHKLLLRSSLSGEHGPRLLERLANQNTHPLVKLLLKSLGDFDHGNVKIYQAMLEQGLGREIAPALEDAAYRYLKAIITRLEDYELDAPWVSRAILWLGRLNPQRAESVLRDILAEKRWLFFPVWPKEAREAARAGLALLRGGVLDHDYGLDEE